MHCNGLSSTAFKLLFNSEIDSNASMPMQQGINITTDRSFHYFVWIVSVDCLSVSASFLALNALKLTAFLLRVLAARWAWRLS